MPMQNALLSEIFAQVGSIDPDAQAAGAVSTAYIDMGKHDQVLASIMAGVLGASATLDAKLEQATSSGGAGVKDITGKAITQLVKATDDDKQAQINCRAEELDIANGFSFVRLTMTVGTATSQSSATVWAGGSRYEPASDDDEASVAEIVN